MSLTTLENWPSAVALGLLAVVSVLAGLCLGISRWALGEAVQLRSQRRALHTPRAVAAACLMFAGGSTIPCYVGALVLRGHSVTGQVAMVMVVALANVVYVAFRWVAIGIVARDERYDALTRVAFAADRQREVALLARELGLPKFSAELRPTLTLAALVVAAWAAGFGLLLV